METNAGDKAPNTSSAPEDPAGSGAGEAVSAFLEDVLPRRGARVVLIGTLFLLGAAGLGIVTAVRTNETVEYLDRAYQLRDVSGRLRGLAMEADIVETRTASAERAADVERLRHEADRLLTVARAIATRNDQSERITEVDQLLDARIREIADARTAAQAGREMAEALKAKLDEFRSVNAQVIDRRRRSFAQSIWLQLVTMLAAAGGILVMSVLFVRNTYRHLDELAAGRSRLREMNASLEEEVAGRTRELSRINQLFATSLAGSRVSVFSQNRNLVYSWMHNPPFGRDASEFIGKSDLDVVPERGRDVMIAAKLEAMAAGRSVTVDVESGDAGRPIWLRLHVDPLFEGERIAGVVCAAVDVTDDRRARERLAALTDELAAALQRFDVALRGADIIVSAQDMDRRFTFISQNALGFESKDVIGRRDEDIVPDDLRDSIVSMKEEVLHSGRPRRSEFKIMTQTRGERWMKVRVEPQRDHSGAIVGLLGCAVDVTAEARGQERLTAVSDELRTTVKLFETALRGADVVVFTQDCDLAYTWVSAPVAGRPPEEMLGRADDEVAPPDIRARLIEFKRDVLAEGKAEQSEFRFTDADGDDRWYALRVEPNYDLDGHVAGLIGALVDVTERRQRETHIRVLMRELTHRTKNLLAVIQAMARQTLTASVSARDFESRFSGRLQGLASSLDILVHENWEGASIAGLVRSQLSHYEDFFGKRIEIDGPEIMLTPEAAQNLGLALHELSTNSSKYGALSVPEGIVSIRWGVERHGGEDRFRFAWRERNGPPVTPPKRKGFGHAVIERLVPKALAADVKLRFDADGASWEVDAPATVLQGAAPAVDNGTPETRAAS